MAGPEPNPRLAASHSDVMALAQGRKRHAVARARQAQRWTVSDHDFPEAGFGRIFLGTK
jgi:hypothetical protein